MGFENSILLQADDFYEAYLRCIEGKNHKKEQGIDVYSVINIPAIVNAAFACELYLKSMVGGIELQKHNLIKFYKLLPQDIKKTIGQQYRTNKVEPYNTAKKAITIIRNSFVEWRYLYSDKFKDQCNSKTLNDFLRIFSVILPILRNTAHNQNN